jgi:redox-sensitive bicupin YhaK (pirin superfamily)
MKKLLFKQRQDEQHWVGDGFPVRSIFTYNDDPKHISPFLLMDYAGPVNFPPSNSGHTRGVGEHPHRGFETVTIVYAGEVEHRDSAGGGGKIGPGDVQWMTAASGLVHEEKHGRDFSKHGGVFEMIQLWVNLPAKDKMTKPRYQGISDSKIPSIELSHGSGALRVIAGEYAGRKGPAKTFTLINLWDLRLNAGKGVELKLPNGHTSLVFVLEGRVRLAGGELVEAAELAVLEKEDDTFTLEAVGQNAKILILSGEPINEPVLGYGPFVMNTKAEIQQAFLDFESGRMGQIEKVEEV